jgi:hypothetical protein
MLKSLLATTLLVASVGAAQAAPIIVMQDGLHAAPSPRAIGVVAPPPVVAPTPVAPLAFPQQDWLQIGALGTCWNPSDNEAQISPYTSPQSAERYITHLGHNFKTTYYNEHGTAVVVTDLAGGKEYTFFNGLKTCMAYVEYFKSQGR